mgnify:CR=1 FL=1
MNKIYPNAAHALEGLVQDGMTIAVGGFGLCGIPEQLIAALRDSERRMALAIAGSGTGIWDRNISTGEIHYSSSWKALLGYADAPELIHRDNMVLV